MNYPNYGNASYVTATGAQCITSANAQIIGVLFQASATGNLQIWAGTTATGAGYLGLVRGYGTTGSATVQPAVYVPFPANVSGGFCISQAVADPKLTIFWNPTGGA